MQRTIDQRLGIPQNTLLFEIPTLETVGEEDDNSWRERVELIFNENDVENKTRREQLLKKATIIVDEFVNNQLERMEIYSKQYYDTVLRTLTRIAKRYHVNHTNKLSTESTPLNWAASASLASSSAVTNTSLPPCTGKELVRSGEGEGPLTMVAKAVPRHMTTGTENAQAFVSDLGNKFNARPAWLRDIPPHKTQEAESAPSESTLYPMVRNPPRPLDNWGQRVNEAYNCSEEKLVYETSKIPNPGVKIVGAYPYDTRMLWYKGREATPLCEIKQESSTDSMPPVPPPKDKLARSQSVHIVPLSQAIWENEREVEEQPYETRQYRRHNRTVEVDETRTNCMTSYRNARMGVFHNPEESRSKRVPPTNNAGQTVPDN